MIGLGAVMTPAAAVCPVEVTAGLCWDHDANPVTVRRRDGGYGIAAKTRDLFVPAIWSGPAFHVEVATVDDANSGIGAADGDLSDAFCTIHAAFTAGKATGGACRVLVKPGLTERALSAPTVMSSRCNPWRYAAEASPWLVALGQPRGAGRRRARRRGPVCRASGGCFAAKPPAARGRSCGGWRALRPAWQRRGHSSATAHRSK